MEQNDGAVMLQVNYDNDSETSIAEDWNAICEIIEESEVAGIAFLYPLSREINALAAKCATTKVYMQETAKVEAMIASIEADMEEREQRLTYMWNWIVNKLDLAPTVLHARVVLIMCLPIMARYLPEVETLNGVDTK